MLWQYPTQEASFGRETTTFLLPKVGQGTREKEAIFKALFLDRFRIFF